MKKLFTLFVCGSIAMTAGAQERQMSAVAQIPTDAPVKASVVRNEIKQRAAHATAHKTTSGPTSRWYSYVDYYDTTQKDLSSSVTLSAPYLWNDTLSVDAYSDAGGGTVYNHNTTVSMGSILAPSYSGFNSELYYPGNMMLTSADAYTVDSITVFGKYGRNPAKLGVVDTMRVAIMYGNGNTGSDIKRNTTTNSAILTRYGVTGSMKYSNIGYDTAKNEPAGTTVVVKTVLLDTAAYRLDTTASGTFVMQLGFPAISIPAGNMVSAVISFKSGDAGFVANDTVFLTGGTYKYNMFRPFVGFNGTASAPGFAPYDTANYNDGVFKTLPDTSHGWTGVYIPMWFWSSSTSGSTLQFPYIDYHLNCPTCAMVPNSVSNVSSVSRIRTFPNPANNQLNVSFSMANNADVTVTLTNMLGQEIANQRTYGSGNVVFNTANLPAGIYLCTIVTNGERNTGRVLIAH